MNIPDYRRPPANPAAAIAQSRGWFLFKINNEPMVYRRKAVWYTPLGTNVREFVGDDFEPMGHMLSAKMPTTTAPRRGRKLLRLRCTLEADVGLTAISCVTVHDVECEVDVDDEEIIDYVLDNSQVLAAIMDGYEPKPSMWAKAFAESDSVTQEQMLANLRLLCPYLNIEWKKA